MEHALSLGDQRWDLSDGSDSITIGRASNADIRLTADDQISRIHARLSRSGSTWTLIDESRNGTALNGRRLAAPTPLTNNDQIHIGRSVLTFHETSQAGAPPEEAPSATFTPPAEAPPAAFSPPEPPPAAAYPPPAEASSPADAYPAPADAQYAAPAEDQYAAPSREQYAMPSDDRHAAPAEDQYAAPSGEQYTAPSDDRHAAPSDEQFAASSDDRHAAPADGQYAGPAEEQYAAPGDAQFAAPAGGVFSGQQGGGAYAAPDEASYREANASAQHPESGQPPAAPPGSAERPPVAERFSLAEPLALGDPAAYAPVTPPASRADRGENPFAPPEPGPDPSPYAPAAHDQHPSPSQPDQNANPSTPRATADRGPSLADRGPRPATPADHNQQPSTSTPPQHDQNAYPPPDADRGTNPFTPPEPNQPAPPFAPPEGGGFARPGGESGGLAPPEREPGGYAPPEGGSGGFAPPQRESGGFAPPEREPGGYAPSEGESDGFASAGGEHGASPFAPAEGEPGSFTPAKGEPDSSARPDGEHGASPFAPAEGEQGGFAPAEGGQGASRFAPGEGEQGSSRFVPGEGGQGVSPFAAVDGGYEPSSGGEWADEVIGGVVGEGVAVGPGDWGAYPSADNPEPARSPWAGGMTVPIQVDRSQAGRNESASWPDINRADEPGVAPPARGAQPSRGAAGAGQASRTAQSRQASRTAESRDAQAKTRRPAGPDEVGQVRLGRVLAVAGALLALGLVINLVVAFFSAGPGGALRWLVPPVIALITAMVVALMDAFSPQERAPGRLSVSVIVAIVVVLLGVGVGGFALTGAAKYAAGYFTGKESGEDRLVKPVGKAFDKLTVTVENVTYTSHFTRVELAVKNAGEQSVALPLDSNVAFTGPEGNAIRADDSRSQWPDKFPSGGTEHGTITFMGHLPDNLTTATLTLRSGDDPVAVGVALSN